MTTVGFPPAAESSQPSTRVLVVDDHVDIREPLARLLRQRGFVAETAADGPAMRELLATRPYDLVLLDVTMPGEDGFSLCRHVQAVQGPPVIMLTARGETADRVRGLETGADDYVVKPFEPSELLARIRTVLRRISRINPAPTGGLAYCFGTWQFDPLHGEIGHADGHTVSLSASEARLLHAFVRHPQQVLSRDQLLALCIDDGVEIFDRSIDTQVSRLRRKLEADPRTPRLLKTAWGNGYVLTSGVRVCG